MTQNENNDASAPLADELKDQELDQTAAGIWTLDDCVNAVSNALGNTGSVCTGTVECQKVCS